MVSTDLNEEQNAQRQNSGSTMPEWARWLIQFGHSARSVAVADGEQSWTVITVPDRRLAASLLALGGVLATASDPDSGPIQRRFAGVEEGTPLMWLDSNEQSVFGRLVKVEDGWIYYQKRVHGGWDNTAYRPLDRAESFWPSPGVEEFVGPRPLTEWPEFVEAVIGADGTHRFLSRSRTDVLILGRRTELVADLEDETFAAGPHRGPLAALVRPRGLVGRGEHSRSELLTGLSDPDALDGAEAAVTIVDGAQAYIRLRDFLRSPRVIVVLDRWTASSDDAAAAAMIDRQYGWVVDDPATVARPGGIEVFSWWAAL